MAASADRSPTSGQWAGSMKLSYWSVTIRAVAWPSSAATSFGFRPQTGAEQM